MLVYIEYEKFKHKGVHRPSLIDFKSNRESSV